MANKSNRENEFPIIVNPAVYEHNHFDYDTAIIDATGKNYINFSL